MFDKGKKIISLKTVLPQMLLISSQFLFITLIIGGFSLISRASFTTYERSLSPICVEGGISTFYDWIYKLQINLKTPLIVGGKKNCVSRFLRKLYEWSIHKDLKKKRRPTYNELFSWGSGFKKYPIRRLKKYAQQKI